MSVVGTVLKKLGILPDDEASSSPPVPAGKLKKAREVSEKVRRGDKDAPMSLQEFMQAIRLDHSERGDVKGREDSER